MPTANSSASKEAVTAALLVIGSKILSGRTKDQNIGYIAEYLTAVGVDLKEVRVVGDEEKAIVDALNALRHRHTYVFTTGAEMNEARLRFRHDRHDSYQKTARLAAWFGVHRCTETKKAPGVPGLEVTKHLEGEL